MPELFPEASKAGMALIWLISIINLMRFRIAINVGGTIMWVRGGGPRVYLKRGT